MPGIRWTFGLLSERYHPPHINKIMHHKFVLERNDLTDAGLST